MQKEGKMLINKEQNQVYVIPEKKIPYLKDNSSLPFSILKSMLPQMFFQNEQLFLLLNKMFPLLYFECPILYKTNTLKIAHQTQNKK